MVETGPLGRIIQLDRGRATGRLGLLLTEVSLILDDNLLLWFGIFQLVESVDQAGLKNQLTRLVPFVRILDADSGNADVIISDGTSGYLASIGYNLIGL